MPRIAAIERVDRHRVHLRFALYRAGADLGHGLLDDDHVMSGGRQPVFVEWGLSRRRTEQWLSGLAAAHGRPVPVVLAGTRRVGRVFDVAAHRAIWTHSEPLAGDAAGGCDVRS